MSIRRGLIWGDASRGFAFTGIKVIIAGAVLLFPINLIRAQTSASWTVNNSGNWSDSTNWSSNPLVPGGNGSTVTFSTAPTLARTTTIDNTSRTVGTMTFNYTSNQSWTVNRTGSAELIFDNGASNAQLNMASTVAAVVNISAPISLLSSLDITNSNTGRELQITGAVSAGSAGLKTITTLGASIAPVRFSGSISDGLGTVAMSNSQNIVTITGNNSFTGGFVNSGGRLFVGSNTALGTGGVTISGGRFGTTSATPVTLSNSSFIIGGNFDVSASGSHAVDLGLGTGGVTLTANSSIGIAASDAHLRIGGNITESGSRVITKTGAGQLTLSGNNSYTGGTAAQVGTLNLGHNSALGSGTLTLGGGGNNTITVSSDSSTARVLANNVTLSTTGTATIGVDDTRGKLTFGNLTATQIGSLVVNSNVSFGNLTGAANIVKSGNGTLEFTGTRSGAGSLTVNAGTLLINGGSSGTPGAVNINSGGTLAGNGTVGGAVNVASGGTFAPGNSPGTLTLNNNLTLASGSFSNFEVNGFTSGLFDLAMGGSGNQTVAFGGTLNVTFSGIVSSGAITIFDFENYSGNFSALNFIGLGGGLTADFDETTGVLTVVPEPSTTALVLGAGILGLLASRRRRMACLNEKVSVESSSSSMH